jgi:hypothetical protein
MTSQLKHLPLDGSNDVIHGSADPTDSKGLPQVRLSIHPLTLRFGSICVGEMKIFGFTLQENGPFTKLLDSSI